MFEGRLYGIIKLNYYNLMSQIDKQIEQLRKGEIIS